MSEIPVVSRYPVNYVTALASGYHIFVQIKALRGVKWDLADIGKPDDSLRKRVPVLHYTV